MSAPESPPPKGSPAGAAIAYAIALLLCWTAAWPISTWLQGQSPFFAQPFGNFLYWLVLRILLWVLPSLWLIRRMGRPLREIVGLAHDRSILLWGGLAGIIWGGKTVFYRLFVGLPLHPIVWDWSFVTAVIYVPFVEELAFRGAILCALQARFRFWAANLIAGALFLAIHLPGWYFQDFFSMDVTVVAASVLGILFLGWILGFVAHRAKSVAASTLAHMLNNLFQRFVE